MICSASGGQFQIETQLGIGLSIHQKVLTLCLVAHIYNLTKFARCHKAQNRNMCKVDYQALSYIESVQISNEF